MLRDGLLAWLSGWAAWVPVCFAWVLCWATLILGAPATFALAQGANYAVLGVFPTWRELAGFIRKYFWVSWAWMLVNLAFFGLVFSPSLIHLNLSVGFSVALKWVTIILVVLWMAIQFFSLPYCIVEEKKNIIICFRDAVQTIFQAPVYALVTAGAGIVAGVLSLILVAPLVMGGAALVAVLGSQAVIDRPKIIKLNG